MPALGEAGEVLRPGGHRLEVRLLAGRGRTQVGEVPRPAEARPRPMVAGVVVLLEGSRLGAMKRPQERRRAVGAPVLLQMAGNPLRHG